MSLTSVPPSVASDQDFGSAPIAGVDWSTRDHVTCVVTPLGRISDRFVTGHDKTGLKSVVTRLVRAGVIEVGIERGDGPLVEALLGAGFTVFVIPPAQVKSLRSRYGSAGNKDDRFDAFVLADVVRTDRARLIALSPPSAATTALRSSVRARKDLVAARVSTANQLLAHLEHVLPGAIDLFGDLDNQVSLAFLDKFPTQLHAQWLTTSRLATWLSHHSYPTTRAEKLMAHLDRAALGLTAPGARDCALAHAATTRCYVAVLRTLTAQIKAQEASITTQLANHPDQPLFAALPRTQALRQARLIAEIGDARGRFPTRESLAALAGVVPSTRRSGQSRTVAFRWGVDKQLRDALCDFAGDSRFADPWAADLYTQARSRGHDHNHAVRVLARAWTEVIWRCWHDHIPYDPTKHNALNRVLAAHQKEIA
jgi:transposase